MTDNDLKDVVFHTFMIIWSEIFSMKGIANYENATKQEIVEHMKLGSLTSKQKNNDNKERQEEKETNQGRCKEV